MTMIRALFPAAVVAAAACAAAPAAAGAATPTGNYGGSTSQGHVATASVVKGNAGAPRIKRLAVHWAAPNCGPGFVGAPESTTFVGNGPAKPDGSFGPLQGSYTAPGSRAGSTQKFDWDLRGKVGSSQLSANFHLVVTETDSTGAVTFKCDTGQIALSLPHAGVFIGDTSDQDFGIVALRSRSPSSIKDFRINWQATCTPPPGASHTTAISKLAVSKKTHRFSKTLPMHWVTASGKNVDGTATVKGKRSDASVSGTFSFNGTVTSPSGQPPTDCHTSKITFKARPK
jgi:hypothetical protein